MSSSQLVPKNKLIYMVSDKLISVALIFCLISLTAGQSKAGTAKSRGAKKESGKNSEKEGGLLQETAATLFKYHKTEMFGQPHTINAMPIAYYTFRTGLNFGFRTILESKANTPYRYRLKVQIIASSEGSHKHKLVFDYPKIADSHFGINLRAQWERDLEARYFGVGNNSRNEDELTRKGSPDFVDQDFYLYNLKRPRFTLYTTYRVLQDVTFWLGFGMEQVNPQLKDGTDTSFLAQERPFGHLGGSGRHWSFRLSWDTRTNDVFPTSGFLTELSFEPNFASVNDELQQVGGMQRISKSVSFQRYTFSDAHFIPLKSNRLIFANRLAFEAIAGEAPYYAFGEIAGEHITRAVGGSQSLRGYQSRRFQDKIKLITLSELRYNFKKLNLMSQSFDLIFIAFFDNGRVWHRWSEVSFNNFHTTLGFGLWLNWNDNLILRMDLGRSEEDIIPFFRIGSAF